MYHVSQTTKEKMLEFTRMFSDEQNNFQRFVIVYDYIQFLHKDPLTKEALQKIFDESIKIIGQNSNECAEADTCDGEATLWHEFWMYYTKLDVIYDKMHRLQECQLKDKAQLDQLGRLLSRPYSKQVLTLSFKVINSEVFERLDQDSFVSERPRGGTYFDEQKSILFIKGEPVVINKQDKITNAHKILRHIFVTNQENLLDDFHYAEIAADEFGELDYAKRDKNWWRYRTACIVVNRKIAKQTKDQIADFLVFNTGVKGHVSINKKYL